MDKISLKKFYELNNEYEKLVDYFNSFQNNLSDLNSKIDIDEIINTCDYNQSKDILNIIQYNINDLNVLNQLKDIVSQKRIAESSTPSSIYYYPEIDEITFLNKEEKVNLDKDLKNAYLYSTSRNSLFESLESNILDFLVDKKILKKDYMLICGCEDVECAPKHISQDELELYKQCWNDSSKKDKNNKYNYLKINCWFDDIYIDSIESFINYPYKNVKYSFSKIPNFDLDE